MRDSARRAIAGVSYAVPLGEGGATAAHFDNAWSARDLADKAADFDATRISPLGRRSSRTRDAESLVLMVETDIPSSTPS